MSINIRCAVPGCTNAVIGQCPGYKKGGCGRYYCATHSTGNLCAACAKQKLEEETITAQKQLEQEIAQKLYEDYLQTAERVNREVTQPFGILLGITMIGTILLGCAINSIAVYIVGVVLMITLFLVMQHQVKAKVANIATTKPEFIEFYNVWNKEKLRQQRNKRLAEAGTVAAIIFGVAAATSKASHAAQVREDLRSIRDKLDDL